MFTDLELRILDAAKAYYEGEEVMPDPKFDAMVEEQRSINPDSQVLKVGWGYAPADRAVAHIGQKVGSLAKVQFTELVDTVTDFILEPKFDGASVVTYFVKGEVYRAVTRGDGSIGKDVTGKIKYLLRGVRDFHYHSIRGEVVVPRRFEEIVLQIPKEDGKPYTTTRGFAAGVLNQLEVRPELLQYLEYVPYTIREMDMSKDNMFSTLYYSGLIPNNYNWTLKTNSRTAVNDFYEVWNKIYPIDGVVVSPKDSMNPEVDSYSVKFATPDVIGKVLKLKWSTGSTGAIIPVIVLVEPVLCCGAMLGQMTGHYASWCIGQGIDTGAVITLTRANEVIPKLTGVITPSDVMVPANCPTCGAETKLQHEGHLYCTNEFCPAKTMEQAYKLVETAQIDKGIGKDTWFRFFELAEINNFRDFVNYLRDIHEYGKTEERPLEWFGKVKGAQIVHNALPAIWKKVEEITFADVLYCMNIPDLGRTYAERLGIYTFLELKDRGICAELNFGTNVNVGAKVQERILEMIGMLADLHLYPARFDIPEGVEICITGSLAYGTRDAFAAALLKRGFINQKTVTKNVKFLICNEDKASSKTRAAEKNKVEIVTETQFLNMHNITL